MVIYGFLVHPALHGHHGGQHLDALIAVAHAAFDVLVSEEIELVPLVDEAGRPHGDVILPVGDGGHLAIDLEVVVILSVPVPPGEINPGVREAVVGHCGEVGGGAGHGIALKDEIVLIAGIEGQPMAQVTLAVRFQHHQIGHHVLVEFVVLQLDVELVADWEAVRVEIPGGGDDEEHELFVSGDVEGVIAPFGEVLKPLVAVVLGSLFHVLIVHHRLRRAGAIRTLVGVQTLPAHPIVLLAVLACHLLQVEGEGLAPRLDDAEAGIPVVLDIDRGHLLGLLGQLGIGLGLGVGHPGLLALLRVRVHVMGQQVGGGVAAPDHAAGQLPVLFEGDEEHRRANGHLDLALHGYVGGRLAGDAQADDDAERSRKLDKSVQEALDSHPQRGGQGDADGDGEVVVGLQLPVLEAAVDPAEVQHMLHGKARGDAQCEGYVDRHRADGIADGPAEAVGRGDAAADPQADVGGLHIRHALVQLPAPRSYRENAHVDVRRAHELPALGLVEILGQVELALVVAEGALLLDTGLSLLVGAQVLALPVAQQLLRVVLDDRAAHVDGHIPAGVDVDLRQVLYEGQSEADVDIDDGDFAVQAEFLIQHALEHAGGAGALVNRRVGSALMGHQLRCEGQVCGGVLAEHERHGLAVLARRGQEQLLPLALEGVHVAIVAGGLDVDVPRARHLVLGAVVAHHQARQVLPCGVAESHLDFKFVVVGGGIDHVVFRIHDVPAVEGHHVGVDVIRRVVGLPIGRLAVDGRQEQLKALALRQVHVLDDEITIALWAGIHLNIQMEDFIGVHPEQIDRDHGDAIVIGGVAVQFGILCQGIPDLDLDALHGLRLFHRAGFQLNGDLVLRQHGDLGVHVVGCGPRRRREPV